MTKFFPQHLLGLVLMPAVLTAMTACGGTTTEERRPTAASPVQPSPTTAGPTEVRITLTEFAIESSLTTFQTGVPYRFVIDNAGALAHDFRITPRGESQTMINMPSDGHDHQHGNELMIIKEPDLPPGTTYTADITFEQPGEFEFACHVAGHLAGGMLLPVDVTGSVVSMPTRIAPDSIRYDPAMMPGMACHAMGVTIAGDCTPEDVERIKGQILEKEAAMLAKLSGSPAASPSREGTMVGDSTMTDATAATMSGRIVIDRVTRRADVCQIVEERTILGNCTVEDISRLVGELMDRVDAEAADADPAQLEDHHDGAEVDDHGHEPAATPTSSG